jgi:hypothetical protein
MAANYSLINKIITELFSSNINKIPVIPILFLSIHPSFISFLCLFPSYFLLFYHITYFDSLSYILFDSKTNFRATNWLRIGLCDGLQ